LQKQSAIHNMNSDLSSFFQIQLRIAMSSISNYKKCNETVTRVMYII